MTASITLTGTAVASVGYDPTPSWERQWFDLRTSFDIISGYYAGSSLNNQDAARVVRDGCLAAWSLAEHVPDEAEGMAYRDSDATLKDASDLINTWKHAGRKAKYTLGRVAHDHGHLDGTRSIELEFIEPGRPPRGRDALEMLRSSLDAWATYLTREGFVVDWPPSASA